MKRTSSSKYDLFQPKSQKLQIKLGLLASEAEDLFQKQRTWAGCGGSVVRKVNSGISGVRAFSDPSEHLAP